MSNAEDRNWVRILWRFAVVLLVFYGLLWFGTSSCVDAARYCTQGKNRAACLPAYCPAVYKTKSLVQLITTEFVNDITLGYVKMEYTSNLCNYFVCDSEQKKYIK